MIISNKHIFYIIYLSFAFIVAGLISYLIDHSHGMKIINNGVYLFIFSSVFLLLKNGLFYRTAEFRISMLGFVLIIMGAMMKLMHWPGANEILGAGCAFFPLIYFFYMVRMNQTDILHFIKLIFIICILGGRYLQVIHWPYSYSATPIGLGALFVLVIHFIWKEYKTEKK